MTEDLRTRLDREFEDCTPDIVVDSASLMERGRKRKRSRYAVMGTAALALVMALVVVIGNLPGGDGRPNPATSGSPVPEAQPEFPLPGDLDLGRKSHWIGAPGSTDIFDTNPESIRLEEALFARLRAHGVNPDEVMHLRRYEEGLEYVRTYWEPDEEARWNAVIAKRAVYMGMVLNTLPTASPSGLPNMLDRFEFEAVPKGSYLRGASGSINTGHEYRCDDYTEVVAGDHVVGDWDNTCATEELPGGAQLVTIVSRRTPPVGGSEAPAGSDTAILYLANGNSYVITNVLGSISDKVLAPPSIPAAELGELLRSLPEVIIY